MTKVATGLGIKVNLNRTHGPTLVVSLEPGQYNMGRERVFWMVDVVYEILMDKYLQ